MLRFLSQLKHLNGDFVSWIVIKDKFMQVMPNTNFRSHQNALSIGDYDYVIIRPEQCPHGSIENRKLMVLSHSKCCKGLSPMHMPSTFYPTMALAPLVIQKI